MRLYRKLHVVSWDFPVVHSSADHRVEYRLVRAEAKLANVPENIGVVTHIAQCPIFINEPSEEVDFWDTFRLH